MNQAALLEKLRNDAVATASPARLVTMLYDRMVLDVDRALAALEASDRQEANRQIQHAQAIIAELQSSLDATIWDGASRLNALYSWLTTQLITANVAQDVELLRVCRGILAPLRDAWHEAAAIGADGAAPAAPAGAAPTGAAPFGSVVGGLAAPAARGDAPRELGIG